MQFTLPTLPEIALPDIVLGCFAAVVIRLFLLGTTYVRRTGNDQDIGVFMIVGSLLASVVLTIQILWYWDARQRYAQDRQRDDTYERLQYEKGRNEELREFLRK